MPRRMFLTVWTALVAASPLVGFGQACYGPGDVNRNNHVDLRDYATMAHCLGGVNITAPPPGCADADFALADLDLDGDADMVDFARFLDAFDARYFDYGPHRDSFEAEMLAIGLSGRLRAPDYWYDRLVHDLTLIRAAYAELEEVVADPPYAPDVLAVHLIDGQPTGGFEALNGFYQVIDVEVYSWGSVLTFCDSLNTPLLAPEYEALREVELAEAYYVIGRDDYITVEPRGTTFRYTFDDGWWDCYDGCDCHRFWRIDVDEFGTVTLLAYWEQGWPWCEF